MKDLAEIHLFIIWENALEYKDRIIADIDSKFQILDIYNILWDEDNFSQNLTRFYGQKLPNNSFKEVHCGNGRFTLVIVRDTNGNYEERQTSSGTEFVNSTMFDKKSLYREWTGGGHKIHATNSILETKHDLYLLLGHKYEDYLGMEELSSEAFEGKELNKNLIGTVQWSSLSEMFDMLNYLENYVVLRNFDGLPQSYYSDLHGDIDILVNALPSEVAYLVNGSKVYNDTDRVHYKVNVANFTIRMDVRFVGDGYYDDKWEEDILVNRRFNDGIYIPDSENYKNSLVYHAKIHKNHIAVDYLEKFKDFGIEEQALTPMLKKFMAINEYDFTEPLDKSVFYNAKEFNLEISSARKFINLKRIVFSNVQNFMPKRLVKVIRYVIKKY